MSMGVLRRAWARLPYWVGGTRRRVGGIVVTESDAADDPRCWIAIIARPLVRGQRVTERRVAILDLQHELATLGVRSPREAQRAFRRIGRLVRRLHPKGCPYATVEVNGIEIAVSCHEDFLDIRRV